PRRSPPGAQLSGRPTLSIVTVVRNGARTLRDCLRSVKSQTLAAEHLVIDGASSDETVSILEEEGYGGRYVSEPDEGMYQAMNKGLAAAQGDVVGFLHSDDVFAS